MQRLNSYVHLRNPDTDERIVLGPDDTVPEWAEKLITNPDVWGPTDEEQAQPEAAPTPDEKAPLTKTALYKLDHDELVRLNEEAGIETTAGDTKKTLVENLLAR